MTTPKQEVLGLVSRYPGIHLRRVGRELGLSDGLAGYHLESLLDAGLVRCFRETGYARYFAALGRAWRPKDVHFVSLMRRPVALQVILVLLSNGGLPHSEVASRLGIPRSSASYRLAMLETAGVVEKNAVGRTRVYSVLKETYVRRMLSAFPPMSGDLDAFSEVWDDLFPRRAVHRPG